MTDATIVEISDMGDITNVITKVEDADSNNKEENTKYTKLNLNGANKCIANNETGIERDATSEQESKTNCVNQNIDGVQSSEEMINESGWAWAVLFGCFLSRCLTDGLIACLGIFIIAWQHYFGGSLTKLTWITSLIAGLQFLMGPIAGVLLRWFTIRQTVIAGTIPISIAFIMASFATKTWHLYVTSTIAGVGFGLIYTPSLVILTYYFNKKLGYVSGVSSCGSALGWLTLPSLFGILISYYQWQGTILILAAMVANLTVCGAIFRPTELELKVRSNSTELPNAKPRGNKFKRRHILKHIVKTFDLCLFKNLYFLCGLVSFFLYGAGVIIFSHYLAPRAVHIGISNQNAAFLLSAIGIGSGISRLTHGIIIDRRIMSVTSLTSLSYFICAISNILIPLFDKYSVLMVLAVILGLSSGVYHSTFPIVAKVYVGIDHVSCGLGWLNLSQGIGTILGSYLTGVLVDATGNYNLPFYLAGICFMLCGLFTSAKSLVEYFKHIFSVMATKTALNCGKELKGQVNEGAEFEPDMS